MTGRKRRITISREADVARAVVEASRLARHHEFSDSDASKLATAVSELARNIIKYAGEGEMLITAVMKTNRKGIEAVARDKGPGIADVKTALQDHYSTSGTLGLGLPGVRRMMDDFEIDTTPGKGTSVTIRLWRDEAPRRTHPLLQRGALRRQAGRKRTRGWGGVLPDESGRDDVECAYFTRPCLGERTNGDAVLLERRGDMVMVALVDGLGHGRQANEVATAAVRHLRGSWPPDASKAMSELNTNLAGSIGGAAGIAVLDVKSGGLRFVGVGNTVARSMGSPGARLYSVEGNLGTRLRTLREQRIQLEKRDLVVLYTDGVRDRFELDDYPQMMYESAKTVAQSIVERFGRSHDDATCIALRCQG